MLTLGIKNNFIEGLVENVFFLRVGNGVSHPATSEFDTFFNIKIRLKVSDDYLERTNFTSTEKGEDNAVLYGLLMRLLKYKPARAISLLIINEFYHHL